MYSAILSALQCDFLMFLNSVVLFLRPYHVCVSLYHRMILGSEQPYLGEDFPVYSRNGGLADAQGSLLTQTIQ